MFTPSPSFFQRPAPACADPAEHQNGCDCAWVEATLSKLPADLRPNLQKRYSEIRGEIRSSWPTIEELRADNARRVAANQLCLDAVWASALLESVTEDFRAELQERYWEMRGESEDADQRAKANQFLLAACK